MENVGRGYNGGVEVFFLGQQLFDIAVAGDLESVGFEQPLAVDAGVVPDVAECDDADVGDFQECLDQHATLGAKADHREAKWFLNAGPGADGK